MLKDPKWTPINRDDDVSEGNVNRKAYIASIAPQDHKSIR